MSAATAFLKKLILWPVVINLPLALLFSLVEDCRFAGAFIAGAVVCWLANMVFALPLLQKIRKRSRHYFLMLFYLLECVKLFLYAALFIVVLTVWQLSFQPMVLGFVLNLCAYGLIALLSLGDG